MLAIGSDHAGFELKKQLMDYFDEKQIAYHDYGTYSQESCNYPEIAAKACKGIIDGECDKGILICGTGIGISISANKIKGIRCAACSEPFSASLSRKHNDSNVLALGARVIGIGMAIMIVENFLQSEFEGGRHQIRVDLIRDMER